MSWILSSLSPSCVTFDVILSMCFGYPSVDVHIEFVFIEEALVEHMKLMNILKNALYLTLDLILRTINCISGITCLNDKV